MHGLLIGPPLLWPKNQGKSGGPYSASRPKLLMSRPLKLPNISAQFCSSGLRAACSQRVKWIEPCRGRWNDASLAVRLAIYL